MMMAYDSTIASKFGLKQLTYHMTKLYLSLLAGAFVCMNAQAQTYQLVKEINANGHTQIDFWGRISNKTKKVVRR